MRNIFIIHGSYGHPEENWFPWLKKELESLGHKVLVPRFPVPKNPDPAFGGHRLDKWLEKIGEYKQYIDEETIFIVHSRGCVFMYHFLAQLDKPVAAAFLVAPWIVYRWYPKGWKKVDSFHEKPFLWNKIKKSSKFIEIFQSTNDDTPVEEGKEIAEKLGAEITVVKKAGHFNVSYDKKFREFPLLLEQKKKYL